MSNDRNPLTQRYLDQLGGALNRAAVAGDECRAILAEIESHLAESVSSGSLLPEALERLGPAEDLARAYAVELALNPRRGGESTSPQKVLGLVTKAGATVASTLLVIVMGGIGLGFVLGGALAVLAGLIAPFLPSIWLDPTLRAGLPQLVVVLLGLVLLGIGIVSLRIVHLNARFLFGALRKNRTQKPNKATKEASQ